MPVQSQMKPAPQSPSTAQPAGQAALTPSHTTGAQLGTPALPLVRRVQVPLAVAPRAAAHTSQAPPHAALQQKPSEQKPEPHWAAREQHAPLACRATHWPAQPQTKPAAQSASAAQDGGQVALVPSHR